MNIKFRCLSVSLLLTILWSCGKEKFGNTMNGAWKVEKIEWTSSTPSMSRSGINEPHNNFIVFKENGKGQWMFDNNNTISFSYKLGNDVVYLNEHTGENIYSIVTLTKTSLILDLVKEQVDWDNDGVLENVHNVYHCKRAY